MYTAVIEIAKGLDRRVHKSIATGEFVDYGPIKEVIPINEGRMPVTYGFIKNTLNKDEGDEIDVLLFSENGYSTGDEVQIVPVGMLIREDLDHKVLAVEEGTEKLFSDFSSELQSLVLNFFGYKHRIISIEGKKKAIAYINKNIKPL